jgi:hypothetical protein
MIVCRARAGAILVKILGLKEWWEVNITVLLIIEKLQSRACLKEVFLALKMDFKKVLVEEYHQFRTKFSPKMACP